MIEASPCQCVGEGDLHLFLDYSESSWRKSSSRFHAIFFGPVYLNNDATEVAGIFHPAHAARVMWTGDENSSTFI